MAGTVLDLRRLSLLTAIFRKGSPNIAAAFDEVGLHLMALDARLTALETPPPPPPAEWPIPPQGTLQTSPKVNVTSFGSGSLSGVHVPDASGGDAVGVRIMQWPPVQWAQPFSVRDIRSQRAVASPPRSANGTGEANIWYGQTVDAARVEGWDSEWMSLLLCSRSYRSLIEHHRLDSRYVGAYLEHVSAENTLRFCDIASDGDAVRIEWGYGPSHPGFIQSHADFCTQLVGSTVAKGRAFSYGNLIEHCKITSRGLVGNKWGDNWRGYDVGVRVGAGSFGNRFRHLDFSACPPSVVRFQLPSNLIDPSRPNIIEEDTIVWGDCPVENRIRWVDDPIG